MGLGYLFIEVREVVAAKQLTNITIFALLFILASYQLSHCRLYLTLRKIPLATRCYRASCLMFIASLMAVFDACYREPVKCMACNSLYISRYDDIRAIDMKQ